MNGRRQVLDFVEEDIQVQLCINPHADVYVRSWDGYRTPRKCRRSREQEVLQVFCLYVVIRLVYWDSTLLLSVKADIFLIFPLSNSKNLLTMHVASISCILIRDFIFSGIRKRG